LACKEKLSHREKINKGDLSLLPIKKKGGDGNFEKGMVWVYFENLSTFFFG
jgi:hypothetical protein